MTDELTINQVNKPVNPEENGRLDKLEDHAIRTEGRLNAIERTQSVHGDKLDQIVNAVTRQESRPAPPDPLKVLTFVAMCVGIFGAATTGITYIANSISYPAVLEAKLRNEFLTQRLDRGWYTTVSNLERKGDLNGH